MAVFVISYDLNKPGQHYTDLYDRIRSLGDWCHPVDSTWYVQSLKSALEITNHLLSVIDRNDSLIVSKVDLRETAFYNLAKEIEQWLGNHI